MRVMRCALNDMLADRLPPFYTTMFACVSKACNNIVCSDPVLEQRRRVLCAHTMQQLIAGRADTIPQMVTAPQRATEFYQKSRPQSLNWLMHVTFTEKMDPRLFFHAVALFDRFYDANRNLQTVPTHIDKIELVATACLVIACKLHGVSTQTDKDRDFGFADLVKYWTTPYVKRDAAAMERIVLTALDFRIAEPVLHDGIYTLLRVFNFTLPDALLVLYLVRLAQLDPTKIGEPPMHVLAAVFSVVALLGMASPFTWECFADMCGADPDWVAACVADLLNLFVNDCCAAHHKHCNTTQAYKRYHAHCRKYKLTAVDNVQVSLCVQKYGLEGHVRVCARVPHA